MSYSRFESVMNTSYPTYEWEALTVTTSDDYILTLFHVWNPETRDADKGPVIWQHGASMDGTSWLEWNSVPAPHFHMADLGHDIYIGNNRGTEYSQGHTTLSAENDQPDYWDFTWDDMALDTLANLEAMYDNAGTGKGWYYGFSQGTIQMLVGLTKFEAQYAQYLNRVVLLAPCTVIDNTFEAGLSEESMAEVGWFRSIDVYATLSPTWEWDVNAICENTDSTDVCETYQNYPAYLQPESMKADDHWAQNTKTRRFQEFVDDWAYPGTYEAPLYPLEDIDTIPISLIIGEIDPVCKDSTAKEFATQLSTLQNVVTMIGTNHDVYELEGDKWFEILTDELITTTISEPNYYDINLNDQNPDNDENPVKENPDFSIINSAVSTSVTATIIAIQLLLC